MAKFNGDAPMLILMFIGVLIGVIFLGSIANQTIAVTSTANFNGSATGGTTTMPLENVTIDLTGRDTPTGVLITNATSGLTVGSGNYTVSATKSATTGLQTVSLKTLTDSYAGRPVNVSYGYNPDGYVDGSSRTLILLIIIFGALAVLLFVVASLFAPGSSFGQLVRDR